MTSQFIAIPTSVAESVRSTMTSPFANHPAHVELATGYGPCRHCLRTFRVGQENRILFTYDPFANLEPEPLPGPVFIHEDSCERYPDDGGFPDDLRSHPMTLNAYSLGRKLLAQEHATDQDIDVMIERLLARSEVDYIHVRDTEAGCYDLRVERVDSVGS